MHINYSVYCGRLHFVLLGGTVISGFYSSLASNIPFDLISFLTRNIIAAMKQSTPIMI